MALTDRGQRGFPLTGDKVLRLFALKILRKESVLRGMEGTEYIASDSSVIHGGVVPEFLKINIL